MYTHTLAELTYLILVSLFLLGMVTLATGIVVLLTRTMGKDLRAITKEASNLAKKGLIEDLSGFVGNASALLSATSEMVKTTAGVGILLIILGMIEVAAVIGLIVYLN